MKKSFWLFLFVGLSASTFAQWKGAWQQTTPDGATAVMICADNYLMIARYKEKQFLNTEGGTFQVEKGKLTYRCEFNTTDSTQVQKTFVQKANTKGKTLKLEQWGNWQPIDDGNTPATAIYRITGRMNNDGKISQMQRGSRKTLKILSGTRFQWAAINTETKQFFGSGGGTYTIKDGKYTENIEFFSRDNSRVGASLTFDYELKDGKDWHHSGLSSTGNKIYEIWSKEPQN
ncbi:MAG: membrane or secreted protein [Runella sp.]